MNGDLIRRLAVVVVLLLGLGGILLFSGLLVGLETLASRLFIVLRQLRQVFVFEIVVLVGLLALPFPSIFFQDLSLFYNSFEGLDGFVFAVTVVYSLVIFVIFSNADLGIVFFVELAQFLVIALVLNVLLFLGRYWRLLGLCR